jgi:hypothetical protein
LKRHAFLILKGLVLGLAAGVLFSAAVLALYRATHTLADPQRVTYVGRYFLTVGALLGLLGGWMGGLHAVLWSILEPVLWRTAGFLPAVTGRIDAAWVRRLSEVMDRVMQQTGFVLRALIRRIFMPGLRGWERYNEAVEAARRKDPQRVSTPQGLSYAALSLFIRPVWVFFYLAYIILTAGFLVFLGVPFLR